MYTHEQIKILDLLGSIKESEEIVFKLNEKGNLKWVKRSTKGGEIHLQKEISKV